MNQVDFDKLIIDSIDMVTGFDRTTGALLLMLDQVKDGTISNGVETVYGTGKNGIRLSAFDRNKTATFKCTNGYVVTSALAAQTGSDAECATESETLAVPEVEFLTVEDGNTVTLTYTAAGPSGNEVPFIYKANRDRTQGQKFSLAPAASQTEFAFDPATKKITLPAAPASAEGQPAAPVFQAGDIVIVPYRREASVGKKISNGTDSFSKYARLILDVTCHDICDQNIKYHTVFEFPNAKIDGNFEMAFGNEPMVHNFGAEAMADPCAARSVLWNYYIA